MKFSRQLGIDKTVFTMLFSRAWTLLSSPITILLTASCLTSIEQGYYYVFSSILGAAVFLEFGLAVVIGQFVSHEMAAIKWTHGSIPTGNGIAIDRLASLFQLGVTWYSAVAVLVLIVILPGGFYYLGLSPLNRDVSWEVPWILIAFAGAVNFAMSPIVCTIEGAGFIEKTVFYRLVQAIVATLTLWIGLLLHLRLFALPLMSFSSGLIIIGFVYKDWRKSISFLVTRNSRSSSIRYFRDVLPLHFQTALSWLSGYLIFSLCTPIIFASNSDQAVIDAGKYGLTVSLLLNLIAVSQIWITKSMPELGRLIACKQFDKADRLFVENAVRSLVINVSCTFALNLLLFILVYYGSPISNRLLSPFDFFILSSSWIFGNFIAILSQYTRTYKKDPLSYLAVASGVCFVLSAYLLMPRMGLTGVVLSQFVIQVLAVVIALPKVVRLRTEWQRDR